MKFIQATFRLCQLHYFQHFRPAVTIT